MYETYSTIVGRVISDPRRNRKANGDEVISFRMASNTRRRDRTTGEWIDGNSLFLTVSCWRRLVAGVASAVEKGRPVIVHGAIHTNSYTTSGGESRTELEMIADSVGLDLARCVVEYRGRGDAAAPQSADTQASGVDTPDDAAGAAA